MLAGLANAVKEALGEGYAGLWASGDMLWEFGSEKNLSKLLAYEIGLEELMRSQPALCGNCQYHLDVLPVEAVQVALYTHEAVCINEMLARLNPHYDKPRTLRCDPSRPAAEQVMQMLQQLPPPCV